MIDATYAEALRAAPEPHVVLLGPVPCSGCHEPVEWAGVDWLNAGTLRRHEHTITRLYPHGPPTLPQARWRRPWWVWALVYLDLVLAAALAVYMLSSGRWTL